MILEVLGVLLLVFIANSILIGISVWVGVKIKFFKIIKVGKRYYVELT